VSSMIFKRSSSRGNSHHEGHYSNGIKPICSITEGRLFRFLKPSGSKVRIGLDLSGFQDLKGLKEIILIGLVSACSLGLYLLVSHLTFRLGFPLDDSWIHQTYARNLALFGEWSFQPGEPSGGSTGPLWGLWLSIGHLLHLGPYLWTYFLGWLMLFGLAVLGGCIFREICSEKRTWSHWIGVVLTLEWHLVWAAGSGMETLMVAAFLSLVFLLLLRVKADGIHWLGLGILVGSSVWLRPDGITLLGPTGLILLALEASPKTKFRLVSALAIGFLIAFGPYLLFNQQMSGAWWPNTFYAKQAEYAIYRQDPLWLRYLQQVGLPLVGVGAVLVPGFVLFLIDALRRLDWRWIAVLLWIMGYLGVYALRLPVVYQHGRYVIPMMPMYFILGMAGLAGWIQPASKNMLFRVVSRAWTMIAGLVLFAFWILGAKAYGQDVAIIESEMVTTAQWVSKNTPEEVLIAAHDIGALGYYADRSLLDLAGLVSPEVIPIIRDEDRLILYLNEREADYLVTFPGWYPNMVTQGELVFQTSSRFGPCIGGENMAVYRWLIP
jgi:hypothetical protein